METEKPKRWTWDEYPAIAEGGDLTKLEAMKKMFHVNEPLIYWQEKRIKELEDAQSLVDKFIEAYEARAEIKEIMEESDGV